VTEDGSGSESEADEEALGRAEELRRERLNVLVKRNLTAILLDVTDAIFGVVLHSTVALVLVDSSCTPCLGD
jgi:hypothetical protein